MNRLKEIEDRTDRAIEWFVRLRAADLTKRERKLFFDWLGEQCSNQHAFMDILELWDCMSVVKLMDFEEFQTFPKLDSRFRDLKRKAVLSAAS